MTDEQLHAMIGRMALEIEALRLALIDAQSAAKVSQPTNAEA